MNNLTHFEMIAAALIGILSVARTARLLIHDVLPPVVRFRIFWDDHVRGGWNKLMHCHFCLTPWLAVGMATWFYLSEGHWTWWVVNGVWGLSYLSAMAVSYDQWPELPE